MKITDMSPDERPREKLKEKGPEALSNAELLAIILRTGTGKKNALDIARELLRSAGGTLTKLAGHSSEKMMQTEGIGLMKALTIAATMEIGRRFAVEKASVEKISITNARMVSDMMTPLLKGIPYEECWVIFLNRANYVTDKEKISKGGTSATIVDIKLITCKAIEKMASGVILVHNHPSGSPKPGKADIELTKGLKKALSTFDIALLDHVVIANDRFFSFAEDRVEIIE